MKKTISLNEGQMYNLIMTTLKRVVNESLQEENQDGLNHAYTEKEMQWLYDNQDKLTPLQKKVLQRGMWLRSARKGYQGYDKHWPNIILKNGELFAYDKNGNICNINEGCSKILNEGIYDYPDTIDQIILCAENDRECYDISRQLVQSLMKKVRKGVELSADQLSNSSWMKKFQQFCFRKFKQYQEDYDKATSPKLFRDWWAEKMIDDVNNEIYNEENMDKIMNAKW